MEENKENEVFGRPNEIQRVQIESFIASALLKGYMRAEILQIVEKKFGVRTRTIDKYIARAKAMIREAVQEEKEYMIALAKSRFEDLYKLNYRNENYSECRAILNDEVRVFGIAPTAPSVVVSVNGISDKTDIKELSTEELENELIRIRNKRRITQQGLGEKEA